MKTGTRRYLWLVIYFLALLTVPNATVFAMCRTPEDRARVGEPVEGMMVLTLVHPSYEECEKVTALAAHNLSMPLNAEQYDKYDELLKPYLPKSEDQKAIEDWLHINNFKYNASYFPWHNHSCIRSINFQGTSDDENRVFKTKSTKDTPIIPDRFKGIIEYVAWVRYVCI